MGLINETNAQYYSGQQTFPNISNVANPTFTCTFDTKVVSAFDSTGGFISSASNYTIYINNVAMAENLSYVSDAVNNVITLRNGPYTTASILIELKQPAIEENYNSYSYISLKDIVNNFIVAYVGMDKNILRCRRSDVIFHAKRGLQEFSYDTLKSIKSQELSIPSSLGVPIPQDYVNYVRCSWIDGSGVQHIIYPVNNLTTSPFDLPIQDGSGVPIQDSFSKNIQADQSLTEQSWNSNSDANITGDIDQNNTNVFSRDWWKLTYGQRYDLAGKLIVLEYISDGLSYDIDSKVPKMAEDALYAYINHSILSTKANVPEYIVQRYQREKSAKLRNAKIRLSNIKLDEIVQVMRGKSKWIKN